MTERHRLADLLGGLSIVADLGFGLPTETAMRSCLIGTELARRLSLSEPEVSDVLYVSLLLHVGCVAYSHETATLFGDDLAVNNAAARTNIADIGEIFSTLIPESTRGLTATARLKGALRMTVTGQAFGRAHDEASCEVARATAHRIGLPDSVGAGLYDVHEWWNGRGARRLHGDDIALAARIARVATEASVLAATRGAESVTPALRRRSAKTLDPDLVSTFVANATALLDDVTSGDPRTLILEAEPTPAVDISSRDIPRVAAAFGDLADIKTPYTHGHSSGVARLSVGAAQKLELDAETTGGLEVAALLHDIGRIAVSNKIWEKPGPLTFGEWEQVRLHPYHAERIMASTAGLAPMAQLVGMHHERLDGSGYHRGCRGGDIGVAARVLGAADALHAMTQPRPHRAALTASEAADRLVAESGAGRLDPEAVAAVVAAAGQPRTPPVRHPPAGLTDREIEVLRLVAAGCSNPEIGKRLSISRRTAEHHVQHVYTKIGISTRAAAALFALEHDLLPPA
jgi:HD-GYP domain-containing protein (c-di-GMP phosphodiesterase class II)